ncbi:MAG: formate dehydrogenase accessory sulfurtransferase FdhD, partial [Nocardioides sp.]|nr:formate dehydrogenase accessory sulfurtransferase FdhD [Nocardioides sp.]
MGHRADRRKVVRLRGDAVVDRPDTLAAEEPMEVRLAGRTLAVTMRTPGDDFELAVGFLVSEGFISLVGDVAGV